MAKKSIQKEQKPDNKLKDTTPAKAATKQVKASTATPKPRQTSKIQLPEKAAKEKVEKAGAKGKKTKLDAALEESKNRKPKRKRKPHATRPTPEEEILILERRNLVLDLRKSGASIRQISDHLKSKGIQGASPTQVCADLQYLLSLANKEQQLKTEEYVELEIGIIDDVQFAFYPILKKPTENYLHIEAKKDAANIVITCVKERAKLRNLYKPREIKILTDEDFAKALGIGVEELPDDSNSPA